MPCSSRILWLQSDNICSSGTVQSVDIFVSNSIEACVRLAENVVYTDSTSLINLIKNTSTNGNQAE